MFRLFERLAGDVSFVPNHDGMLVAESAVERVHQAFTETAESVLGFRPVVKRKEPKGKQSE